MAAGGGWRRRVEETVASAGAVRGGLLVLAVLVGALVIANGFPGGASERAPAATPPSGHRAHPGSKHPQRVECGSPKGVRVAVENATTTSGLAAATAKRLHAAGYAIDPRTDIGNAPSRSGATRVFFRGPSNEHVAICLKRKFFPHAALAPLGANAGLSPLVRAAVYLGADYAAAHPPAG